MLNWHQTGQIGGWTTEIVDQSGWFWVGGLFLSDFFFFFFFNKELRAQPNRSLGELQVRPTYPYNNGWMNEGFKAVFTHPHPMWDGDVIEKEHIAWGLEPWTSISKHDMGTT